MVMLKGSFSSSMNAKLTGTGPEVVVLAHGFGGDQSFWGKITPSLAQNYQVLVFDWNFCGTNFNEKNPSFEYDFVKYGSSLEAFGDDLVSLLDEMSIKCCSFVGHSMSGMIGCFASVKRPQLFKKLILIGASPRYLNSDDYKGGFEISEVEQLLSTIESNFHPWASAFAPLAIGEKDSFAIHKFEQTLKSMNPKIALAVAKLVFLGDNRDVLEHVETPCTLISTTSDIVTPLSVPYYMQKKMLKIKSRVEIIDVDGHFPLLTAHKQLLEVLERELN